MRAWRIVAIGAGLLVAATAGVGVRTERSAVAAPSAVAVGVDTSRRSAVTAAYKNEWRRAAPASESVGVDVSACQAGATTAEFRQREIARVNAFRALAGVSPTVSVSDTNSTKAQQAALIFSANGDISHYPPPSWRCWSDVGAEAAANSNIWASSAGLDTIDVFMDDWGPANIFVGHRTSILDPATNSMGVGEVPGGSALWVIDPQSTAKPVRESDGWVSWPPRGFIPYQLVYNRWNWEPAALGGVLIDTSAASVSMRVNGQDLPVVVDSRTFGLVWHRADLHDKPYGYPPTWEQPSGDQVVHMTLGNILVNGVPRSFSWDTVIFDPDNPLGAFRADVAAGTVVPVQIAGQGGVPADARSVVMNVTAVNAEVGGYLTVYPCDAARPETSNVNYVGGVNTPNLVTVKLDAQGRACVFTYSGIDVVFDVAGYYTTSGGDGFVSLVPSRVVDTRRGLGATRLPADATTAIGFKGGNVPTNATGLMVNVTVADAAAPGYLTVYPCDVSRPYTSNVNYSGPVPVPNLVAVRLPADGRLCFSSSTPANVIVDLAGYFTNSGGSAFQSTVPVRIVDTRSGLGGSTLAPSGARVVQVAAAGTPGATMNMTVTNPRGAGYLTVYPCDAPQPEVSNLNFSDGQSIANMVSVKLAANGTVCVVSTAPTDVLVDLAGLASNVGERFVPLTPARVLDTRSHT